MKLVIVICVFIGHVYSKPSPCIDLCRTTSIRPGNWTEHNDYVTDNGTGRVHEERGQLVNGASKVHYYKRNYASTHGTGTDNAATSPLTSDYLNTHNKIDRVNVQNYEQPNYYNEQNSHLLRSSSTENFGRLENLGEQTDTQIHENTNSRGVSNTGDNWTRHNSYVTDGGHGKVYEEEGQYKQGSTKVRYHKKNYTSSFSTSGNDDSGVGMIPIMTVPNIHSDIDAQLHQLESQVDQISSHINQQTRHLSQNIDNINLHRDDNINRQINYQSRNNHLTTNRNIPGVNRVDVVYKEHGINTRGSHEQIAQLPSQNQYIAPPITHVQSTRTHHQVEKQTYVPISNINSQINSHSSHHQQHHNDGVTIRIPVYRINDGMHITSDSNGYLQNQQLNQYEKNLYNNQPQIERHVEQHFSASERQSHSTIPQQIDINNHHDISNGKYLELLGQEQYKPLTRDTYDNVNHGKTNNYISGSSSSYYKNYKSDIHQGNVHSETIDHEHHGADCDGMTQVEYNRHHGRIRYRRGVDHQVHQRNEFDDSQQHTENLEFSQQNTQQYQDSTQQHERGFGDLTQQQSGNLELDQQHQSHMGQLEFGQQTEIQNDHGHYNQNNHHSSRGHANQDSMQQSTHGFEDYTQQHTGTLDIDQQHSHQYQQSHQKNEFGDFTQQQSGNLELDQQHQSHMGQLEFGQQTEIQNDHGHYNQNNHHSSRGHADQDSMQQSTHGFEDYTQQHTGTLDIDQQHSHQYQQSHQSHMGQLEFGQQTENQGHHSQFENHDTQQSGSLEFGQQHELQQIHNQNYEQQTHGNNYNDHVQKIEDLTQQTGNVNDFSQQTSENLEFGQQSQNNNEHNYGLSKPAPKPVPRSQRIGNYGSIDTEIKPMRNPIGVKGGHRTITSQETHNSHYSQPTIEEQSHGVLSLEQQIRKDESINVFQPRILEAYGGNGPYNPNHHENIYNDVKLNPSATLTPTYNSDGKDPWDIREAESMITETSTTLYQDDMTTTVAPGFWKRVGNKITNTYEKAKDKVVDVFG